MNDPLSKYICEGEDAGNFSSTTKVWSEMSVRTCVARAEKDISDLRAALEDKQDLISELFVYLPAEDQFKSWVEISVPAALAKRIITHARQVLDHE